MCACKCVCVCFLVQFSILSCFVVCWRPPSAVVYSCGCATRVHSVASLRNDAAVVCCNHDGTLVVCSRSGWACIRVRVFCVCRSGARVACDTLALCGIRVCVCGIQVSCCSLRDAMVACNGHNDDGLVFPRGVVAVVVVEDNVACALRSVAYALRSVACTLDNVACIRHAMDSEAPMEACRTYRAMVLALPKQLPQLTRKLSVIWKKKNRN